MTKTRIIKRYQNRKLYDTYKSCYVTLDQIAKMLREGDDVTVIDNKTQRDITAPTLIQIMFEGEKKAENPIPTAILKNIVKKGNGAILEYVTRSISEGIASRFLVRDELEKRFEMLAEKNIVSRELSVKILDELTSTTAADTQEKALNTELENNINVLQNALLEKTTTL